MKLYFLRHGIAEEGSSGGDQADFNRALTEEGIRALEIAAKVLAKLDLEVTHVFTSPRLRAAQTADIAAKALGMTPVLRDELNYGFNLHQLGVLVQDLPQIANVMVVGHEPTFSETLSALTGANLAMKKGGLARVDLYNISPLRGQLVWLIAPKVFEALA